jgi:hypothetical protein
MAQARVRVPRKAMGLVAQALLPVLSREIVNLQCSPRKGERGEGIVKE